MKKTIVITTINKKTKAVKTFAELLPDWDILLIGDKKSQPIKSAKNLFFITFDEQLNFGFKSVEHTPINHYARKNLGYLIALQNNSGVIYDTDDDNLPYDNWKALPFSSEEFLETKKINYLNAYEHFTNEHIWPRGLPLDEINNVKVNHLLKKKSVEVGVWQGLADQDPDVDAIFRLTTKPKTINFKKKRPIVLGKNLYCPFNSQNTLWNKQAFPLLYLPITVSFRFTDILRGYIAQHLMWQHNLHLGFHEATVYQERNVHNLMKDFMQEIECYTLIKDVVEIMQNTNLGEGMCENMISIYRNLEAAEIVKSEELIALDAWIADIKSVTK